MKLENEIIDTLFDGAYINGFTVISNHPQWNIREIIKWIKENSRMEIEINIRYTELQKILNEYNINEFILRS